ncbi:MAG TPA: hypothetical protein VGD31_15695, partial [Sphingobacteriaceae bacterium]
SLIDPTGPDFLKDFPSQNEVNLDRVDSFAGPCLTTHALRTFTPDLTSTGTKPVLGTGGYIRGFYYQIWDQIYTWCDFRFGTSGINVGTGIYIITLPFTVDSSVGASTIMGNAPIVGNGATFDDSSIFGSLPLTVHLRSSTQLMFGIKMNSGLGATELSATGYIPWAVNDGVSWSARFKRVDTV